VEEQLATQEGSIRQLSEDCDLWCEQAQMLRKNSLRSLDLPAINVAVAIGAYYRSDSYLTWISLAVSVYAAMWMLSLSYRCHEFIRITQRNFESLAKPALQLISPIFPR